MSDLLQERIDAGITSGPSGEDKARLDFASEKKLPDESPGEAERKSEKPIYEGVDAVARAADELKARSTRDHIDVEVHSGEYPNVELTPRQAADKLKAWREQAQVDHASLDRAMGLTEEQPAEELQTPEAIREREIDERLRAVEQATQTAEYEPPMSDPAQQWAAEDAQAENQKQQIASVLAQQLNSVGIQTEADLAQLRLTNPELAAQVETSLATAQYMSQQIDQASHVRHQQQWAAYDAQEAQKFMSKHPEFKSQEDLQKAEILGYNAMLDAGWTHEDMAERLRQSPLSYQEREVWLRMGRAWGAKQGLKARPAPKAPAPIKPGHPPSADERARHGEKAASDRLDRSPTVRNAAALYAIRRGR